MGVDVGFDGRFYVFECDFFGFLGFCSCVCCFDMFDMVLMYE